MPKFEHILLACKVAGALVVCSGFAGAQSLVTQPVDETQLVTLTGNTRHAATAANDRGPVADSLNLDHMFLQLKRAPAAERSITALIEQLHDPASSQFHRWLTADEVASRFGPADHDVTAITTWLESHGFTINVVYRANGVIDFSGTAAAVKKAFHTEIHNLMVRGVPHIANMSDPKIPAALAPAVHGVVSMNDFRPKPLNKPRPQYSFPTSGGEEYALVPGDLATIYDINPVFSAGITGRGQTIVVVEDTLLYSADDWYAFRQTFGLDRKFPGGSLHQVQPQPWGGSKGSPSCANPGVNGDDGEAALDVEWSSAAAPEASIVLAACADTNVAFGGYIAMQNLLTAPGTPPGIFSVSYGESETDDGASYNIYINGLYQLAVLQGVSVFVASGDWGADVSDYGEATATSGINVSAFASTPYNVAVGGTDFADGYLNDYSTYWSLTNGKYYNSALSYVPEIPWNDTCAGQLASSYLGYPTPYGANGFCNSTTGADFLGVVAGSGGPSECATGNPSLPGVVSGSCKGYRKPSYQFNAVGMPNDGVRDLPDVSLFASNGFWGHYYVFCYSDPTPGYYGAPCTGAPSGWSGAGGTSFASPIMAAIQALANQASRNAHQGNPNYVYYALSAQQSNYKANASCNSTLGNAVSPQCVFHDVTLGDNDLPCTPYLNGTTPIGLFDCYLPSGTYGVLSTSDRSYQPAYAAHPGWDFASGLGSVNALNLVKSWPGSALR
jgi:subtilase family serine protease